MNRCKDCICFDPAHRWCIALGSEKEPMYPACVLYVKDEGDDEGRE